MSFYDPAHYDLFEWYYSLPTDPVVSSSRRSLRGAVYKSTSITLRKPLRICRVDHINITSLSREHVTHALYICYMTMSCICLSLIEFMLCNVVL